MQMQDPFGNRSPVLITGGGAAGMMAAVTAASGGHFVLLLEHGPEPGRKLLMTGNGKCNFTNTGTDAGHYHRAYSFPGDDRAFREYVEKILGRFGPAECMDFFCSLGITPVIRHYPYDNMGYVYPDTLKASDVRDAFLKKMEDLGVRVLCSTALVSLKPLDEGGGYAAVYKTAGEEEQTVSVRQVILATGGNACPATGSDNSIYPVLKELGLEFGTFLPALCALYSKDTLLRTMKGKRLKGSVSLPALPERKPEYGEIQFNEHSLSGIPVMQVSREVSFLLQKDKKNSVLLHVETDSLVHDFEIHRTAGFDRSQCTAGGLKLEQTDPENMEIRSCPGLHVCGELLDIDGDCGGFNLHMAWATGYIAGQSV